MVRVLVANTDFDWFKTLSNQSALDEVNFWQPSGANAFRALAPGELLAFRLKAPRNVIAGFGVKNVADSYEQIRPRVESGGVRLVGCFA